MILNDAQIDQVSNLLSGCGIASEELRDDLLDHICTQIETGSDTNFESALLTAIEQFGGNEEIGRIQRQTRIALNHRDNIRRKRLVYRSAYITAFLLTGGLAFKLMQWPYSDLILISGCTLIIFIWIPARLYQRHKLLQQKI